MRRLLLLPLFLILIPSLARANQNAQGWCETGAQPVVTSGLTSTTQVQQSFPQCTITVFVHGGGVATIFSDNNNTPLSNPFVAQTNGRWLFYAANGRYDIQLSGAGFPSPLTYSDVSLLDGNLSNVATLPNTPLLFSATPVFNASGNASYSMTLTGNVTSSSVIGNFANGNLLSLTLTEDAVGGRTFVFPGNFIFTPTFTFNTTALAINELTFKFDGVNWHLISNVGGGGTGGLSGMTTTQVPIAATSTTVTSSKPVQGAADANILGSGTVTGTAANLCTDANGGATTVGCPTGGNPAAPNFQAQVYNNGAFAATPCFNVTVPSSFSALGNLNCDIVTSTPNPVGVDVRGFGGAPFNPNLAPAINGVTANCNGTTTLTLNAASLFVNGVGVTALGCGPTITVATPGAPTVANSMVRSGQTTGDVVAGATGSSTYNYKIAAQDLGMGTTAASATGTITTGAATLGAITTNITSCSRSNTTVTCITSAHSLPVGCSPCQMEVKIRNMSDQTFVGNWQVATVPDSTHFTYTSTIDTRNGAVLSATGGQAIYWPCNHLTWTAVTGAIRYLIYSDRSPSTPGNFKLIGISKPFYSTVVEAAGIDGSLYFDDFGATTSYGTPPWDVPTTAPASALNDALTTTIVSGAGTTTLVVANAASQTISNTPIRVDNAPNIKAAAACCPGGNGVLIPATAAQANNANFVINSILDLSTFSAGGGGGVNVNIAGQANWNETVIFGTAKETLVGTESVPGTFGSFAGGSYVPITVGGAPGIWFVGGSGAGGGGIKRVTVAGNSNGQTALLMDGGGGGSGWIIEDVSVNTGNDGGLTDDQSIAIFLRGMFAGGSQVTSNGRLTATCTQQEQSETPCMYVNAPSDMRFGSVFFSGRAPQFAAATSGSIVTIQSYYCQGCNNVQIVEVTGAKNTGGSPGGIAGFSMIIGQAQSDTAFLFPPLVSGFNSIGNLSLSLTVGPVISNASVGYSGIQPISAGGLAGVNTIGGGGGTGITGLSNGGAIDGIFNTGTIPGTYSQSLSFGAASVGSNYPIFIQDIPLPAPVLTLQAAGSGVPIGNHTYAIMPTWPNGGSGPISASATINVTTGNQNVAVNWTPTVGCTGYLVFRDGFFLYGTNPALIGCLSTSTLDTLASAFGNSIPTLSSGGPSMFMPGHQGTITPLMFLGGRYFGPPSGGFTSFGSIILPDLAGMVPTAGYQNSVYDNFNRGSLGSNWSVPILNGGTSWTISGNTAVSPTLTSFGISFYVPPSNPPLFNQAGNNFAQATLTSFPANSTAGVALGSTSTGQAYICAERNQDNILMILRVTGGFSSNFLASTAITPTVGDIVRIEVNGNTSNPTITCTRNNGTSVITANDATPIAFPYIPGIVGVAQGALDNWSGGNLHPIGQLDTEQDWTQVQHFSSITLGNPEPIPGTIGFGSIYSSFWAPSASICTDANSKLTTSGCAGGALSGMTSGQVAIAGSASTITSSKPIQGTDTNILSSSTVAAGTGNLFCTDTGSGATTSGCPNLSGLTTGQVPIAGSSTTVTSSKALQGTDASVLSSGTVSGTGATLCTDANGGATTVGCTGGSISGLTAGGVAIAGTATTITSSKPQQGTDANILTSGTISATTPALLCTDANSGATTSNCSVYNTQSAATNTNITATNMVASAPANTMYMYMWTVSLTTVGTGCTSTTSVVLNVVFTDPNAGGSITESLGQISIAPGGNGTLGFVAQGVDNIYAKSGTAVQYSTTGYTPGTGCTVNPSYQVTMRLLPIS